MARTLAQVDARLTTEITTRASQVTALDARLDKIEALLATSEPVPPPVVTPPTTTTTASKPLILTPADSGATFTDYAFTGADLTGSAFKILGTKLAPVRDITLVRPRFSKFRQAIEAYFCDGLTLVDPIFDHQGYASILFNSGSGLSVRNPKADTVFRPGPYPTTGGEVNNAYFLKLDVSNPTDPPPDTCEVLGGVLTNASSMWQCLNAHAGRHVKFVGTTISGSPRPIFVARTAGAILEDFTITDNTILAAKTVIGGTTDKNTAIAYGSLKGGLIDRNSISTTFPTKVGNIDQYTGAGITSSGVLVGTNPSVP